MADESTPEEFAAWAAAIRALRDEPGQAKAEAPEPEPDVEPEPEADSEADVLTSLFAPKREDVELIRRLHGTEEP
jgi:hypothetical protein